MWKVNGKGREQERDAFTFTLSFWEVITYCSHEYAARAGWITEAMVWWQLLICSSCIRALFLSCVFRENSSRGSNEILVTNQHSSEYMGIIKYCKIKQTIQKPSAFIVHRKTSRTPRNSGTVSETQKSCNLAVFPLQAFPSFFPLSSPAELFSNRIHYLEAQQESWPQHRRAGCNEYHTKGEGVGRISSQRR